MDFNRNSKTQTSDPKNSDPLAPFTLQKKLGPDTLESSPDQFFLTVYTLSNHVRLTIEKNP